jgi:hypothetical protein
MRQANFLPSGLLQYEKRKLAYRTLYFTFPHAAMDGVPRRRMK